MRTRLPGSRVALGRVRRGAALAAGAARGAVVLPVSCGFLRVSSCSPKSGAVVPRERRHGAGAASSRPQLLPAGAGQPLPLSARVTQRPPGGSCGGRGVPGTRMGREGPWLLLLLLLLGVLGGGPGCARLGGRVAEHGSPRGSCGLGGVGVRCCRCW